MEGARPEVSSKEACARKLLDRGHRNTARGQSFVASKGRHTLDQISSLLKILQCSPSYVLKSKLLTPHIWDLIPFYVQNLILYHSFTFTNYQAYWPFFCSFHTLCSFLSQNVCTSCALCRNCFVLVFFSCFFLGLVLFCP